MDKQQLPVLKKVTAAGVGGGLTSTGIFLFLLMNLGVPENWAGIVVFLIVSYGPTVAAVLSAYIKKEPFLAELWAEAQKAINDTDSAQ